MNLAWLALVWVLGAARSFPAGTPAPASEAAVLEAMVRADWSLQEQRLGLRSVAAA
jgi:hypothetical protein